MGMITYSGGTWTWHGSYDERDVPKAAGFRYDGDAHTWSTWDVDIAVKLLSYCDDEASQAIDNETAFLAAREAAREAARKAAAEEAAAKAKTAIEASRATDSDLEVPVPDGLELFPYQRAGVAYALGRRATLIADEMGLGKTVQAIGVANSTGARSILVVCPLSVKLNWEAELRRWSTAEPPLTIGHATAKTWPDTDVVVAHWDVLAKHERALRSRDWDLAVADEVHLAKNRSAGRTQALFGDRKRDLPPVRAARKLALTGTPIPNRPRELWAPLNWLAPEVADREVDFWVRFCDGHKEIVNREGREVWVRDGASNLRELSQKLRSTVMVRRLKKHVLDSLPPKRRQLVTMDPSDVTGARAALDAERKLVAAAGIDADDDFEAVVRKLEASEVGFAAMSRVRRDVGVAKAPAVAEHVAGILDEGEKKVVVWAHHHEVVDILGEALASYGVVSITGETPLDDRQAAVDAFQSEAGPRVFVGSITAAGTGITLTAAQTAVFAELDWVPGNVVQAEDRCHRIGQTSSVLVQHVVLDGSLDARLAQTLVGKQEITRSALDEEPKPVVALDAPFGVKADGTPRLRKPGPGRPRLSPEEREAAMARARDRKDRWRVAHRERYAAYTRTWAAKKRAIEQGR